MSLKWNAVAKCDARRFASSCENECDVEITLDETREQGQQLSVKFPEGWQRVEKPYIDGLYVYCPEHEPEKY